MMIHNIGGIKIKTSYDMVDRVEDWSEVRSPARARRRMKRGFPQKVKIVFVPKKDGLRVGDTLIIHPAMLNALRYRLGELK